MLAERAAQLTEQRLESEVRRPADAEAYKTRTLADADRDKVKAETEAEAFRQRTLAEANRDTVKFNTEAEANRQRQIAEASAEAEKAAHGRQADAEAKVRPGRRGRLRPSASRRRPRPRRSNARASSALCRRNQALIAANKLIDVPPTLGEESAMAQAIADLEPHHSHPDQE